MIDLLINTNKGQLQGFNTNHVNKFLGIPFGKSPVGNLRFLPPVEPDPWEGVYDATTLPNSPMQPVKPGGRASRTFKTMSEDCLYLNVYTPEDAAGRDLPVMLWLFGGGYTVGSGSYPLYDGENLVKNNDVILVTTNYRVGLFGFMSHPFLKDKGEHTTNAGVADVIATLKWIKNNIANFGGNPNNVTLFGQSAGSSLINIMLLCPESKGLFHAAITQSGSPFNHDEWNIDTDGEAEKCIKYLKTVGIESEEDFYNTPAEKFLENPDGYALAEFCPYVDGYLIPDRLEKCYLEGKIHDVPIIVGCTADEASSLVNGNDAHGSRTKTTKESFGKTVDIKFPIKEHSQYIWKKYGPYTESDPAYALARFRSDNTQANQRYFASCLYEHNESPVYYYIFQHVPPTKDPSFLGAHHGCEVAYVFQNLDKDKDTVNYDEYDEEISKSVSKYWTTFAKNHDPNSEGEAHWDSFDPKTNKIMYLDGPCECREMKSMVTSNVLECFLAERTESIYGLGVKGKEAKKLRASLRNKQ